VGRFPKLVPERFYNYVSNTQPDPPGGVEEGETWYDPDTANSYVYDGATWVDLTVVAHSQLSGISSDDHHNPVTTSDPLTVDAGQGIGMSLGSSFDVASGNLTIPNDGISESQISPHIPSVSTEEKVKNVSGSSATTFTFSNGTVFGFAAEAYDTYYNNPLNVGYSSSADVPLKYTGQDSNGNFQVRLGSAGVESELTVRVIYG
jgi:hypothetical protein